MVRNTKDVDSSCQKLMIALKAGEGPAGMAVAAVGFVAVAEDAMAVVVALEVATVAAAVVVATGAIAEIETATDKLRHSDAAE
jgi:uncharacterized protein (DUF983 family)